jgi:hypothetical protein
LVNILCEQCSKLVSRGVAPIYYAAKRIGWVDLCILMRPLMEGAEGFKLIYSHLISRGICVVLAFIVLLIWVWKVLVGPTVEVWKLFSSRKFLILDSCCWIGRMTRELPLSATVTVA